MGRLATFLLILSVIAALLRADLFFSILYFLLAVFVLSRLWVRRVLSTLRVRRQFEERAFYGEEISADLTIHNTGWLPIPWLEVHESLPVQLTTPPFHRQVVSLAPRERRCFSYTLNGRQRGYYPVGPLRIRSGGPLGIHPSQTMKLEPSYLIVYPQVFALEHLGLPTRSPLVALPARSPLFEDPSCVVGMRDYQPGDPLRRIHWTATASAGRLLVKQYRPSIARETLICLDMDKAGYEQKHRFTAPELAIIVAASLANHILVRDRLAVGLATEAWDPLLEGKTRFFLPPSPERGHLMNLLEVLARVDVAPAAPVADLLRRERVNLSWGATLVVVTGRETEELYDSVVSLRRAGFAVALILVQPAAPSAELKQRAELLGVQVHRVWRERDLREGVGDPRRELWR
jgi:uncharacterized protein (DUF58 family)